MRVSGLEGRKIRGYIPLPGRRLAFLQQSARVPALAIGPYQVSTAGSLSTPH